MPYLAIEFSTENDINNFISWMDNRGEQDYLLFLELQGKELEDIEYDYEKKFITIISKNGDNDE